MVIAWLAVAAAAPVQCDPTVATQVVAEARIEQHRVPVSHPELALGLARAAPELPNDLRNALDQICAPGGSLALSEGESWQTAAWAAYTLLVTRTEQPEGSCSLQQRTIAMSVAVAPGEANQWSLRSVYPPASTPLADCPAPPRFREEKVVAGANGSVRLVLVSDHEGDDLLDATVVVRRASATGWDEQVLLHPAPPRLLDGGSGPRLSLTERYQDRWIVASGNRTVSDGVCTPVPGQTVWTWQSDRWEAYEGRPALTLLASRGLWRNAGEDAWMLIVAQDTQEDQMLLEARRRRLQRKTNEPLSMLPSAWFPELNPGYLLIAMPPWSNQQDARDARDAWGRRRTNAYVKRAWKAPDPCASLTAEKAAP